jgi:hypothetical protein
MLRTEKERLIELKKEEEYALRKLCMNPEILVLVNLIKENCDRAKTANVTANTSIKNIYRNQGVARHATSLIETLNEFIPRGLQEK